ncbi:MAG: hypothetical protein OXG71_07560, partial [Rhodospirillales bacterium]|nr:hypothetical protein [Rhodospirillales bacterium]
MKPLNAIRMAGREILPLIEGGKGISVTNGRSAGAWAFAGGVGTFSGVNADSLDAKGRVIPLFDPSGGSGHRALGCRVVR